VFQSGTNTGITLITILHAWDIIGVRELVALKFTRAVRKLGNPSIRNILISLVNIQQGMGMEIWLVGFSRSRLLLHYALLMVSTIQGLEIHRLVIHMMMNIFLIL
jgi:hypothetical protein